ncbi:hypothetical protein [Saccharolobus caldissimus]|uniref:Uncharacterized protein n=1 Tax=Saccharolobus caldissimus TaxID=1702097 RepID=A0AAQ4CWU5_9CREN|nr:hypothetical protein [Saccharolobus caldissimus]BDC00277.1 hypothetical protein SACC_32930 [Saccharolobus caldissimus]
MSQVNQPNNKVDNLNETKVEQNNTKQKRLKVKKGKDTINEDVYLIVEPNKVSSLRARIENRVIEVLKEEPLISEKELILKLIARDNQIKEYFVRTQEISYLKFVIWDLAKKKIILKAKILGERKRTYFFLPQQIDLIKDKIIQAPKE